MRIASTMRTTSHSGRIARAAMGVIISAGVAAGSYGVAAAATGPLPAPRGAGPAGIGPPGPVRAPVPRGPGAGVAAQPPPGPPGDGIVTAIGPSTLTVETPTGVPATIDTTSGTTYAEAGKKISRSVLHVDNLVRVLAKVAGSAAASRLPAREVARSVDIVSSRLTGVVSGIGSSTITITDFQGFQRQIATSSSTRYTNGSGGVARSAIAKGLVISATGAVLNGSELQAASVVIGAPGPLPGGPRMPPPGKPGLPAARHA